MKKIEILLLEYGDSHHNPTNKAIHWVCVPLIVFSIGGLLWAIPFPLELGTWINWATLTIFAVSVYYFWLSFSIALGMLVLLIGCALLVNWVDVNIAFPLWAIAAIVFGLSWVFQFYGHKLEGKKPSFLKDIQFLLVGPAWLLHFVYKRCGIPY